MVSQHDVKVSSLQKEERSPPVEMQREILLFTFAPAFGYGKRAGCDHILGTASNVRECDDSEGNVVLLAWLEA